MRDSILKTFLSSASARKFDELEHADNSAYRHSERHRMTTTCIRDNCLDHLYDSRRSTGINDAPTRRSNDKYMSFVASGFHMAGQRRWTEPAHSLYRRRLGRWRPVFSVSTVDVSTGLVHTLV